MRNLGYIRVANAVPKLEIGHMKFNANQMIELMKQADEMGASMLLFPELAITGYTSGDLFFQDIYMESVERELTRLLKETSFTECIAVIGTPVQVDTLLYNCAIVIKSGEILGVVPKTYLPNSNEYYEKRWFTSATNLNGHLHSLEFCQQEVPFGTMLFDVKDLNMKFGVEICEDLWAPISPSEGMALSGANLILNPSASNELVSKSNYRKNLISMQSAKLICGYMYTSSGVGESTTDVVFGGANYIYENGKMISEGKKFSRENVLEYADLDLQKLKFERKLNKTFSDACAIHGEDMPIVVIERSNGKKFLDTLNRTYSKTPFIPSDTKALADSCAEIFEIQVNGLAKRLSHTKTQSVVIGISGGLDSALALLVTRAAFDVLGLPSENIYGITMPGFGTTDKTYKNSLNLMKALKVTIEEIDIKAAVNQHFKDIGHDPSVFDITYENSQARERTQILMDYGNKVKGFVIGTGDLSEVALGWSTYNGDHMSMYAVNNSVPKTLVQFMIRWYMTSYATGEVQSMIQQVLTDILDTPISPELLPPEEDGTIAQKTEEAIGPYIVHDFFLYHTIRGGLTPERLYFIAKKTFSDLYDASDIKTFLRIFYWRFITQQFKRSCIPDGPKVGSVSLSPRGDWRMPSDVSVQTWIDALENLED